MLGKLIGRPPLTREVEAAVTECAELGQCLRELRPALDLAGQGYTT